MTTRQVSLPSGFIEQLTPLLGASLPDFLHCLRAEPCRGVRLRAGVSLRAGGEEGRVLQEALTRSPVRPESAAEGASVLRQLSPVPWAENAWYLPADSLAGDHPLHEAGGYYLQEPSAMSAAAALHPIPGERVLDLCAAPGGKSTQLAAYLRGEGVLICNEPVPARAQVLSRNIERMGVRNAVVVSALPEELSPRWPEYFDRVLVDAPCSGEGMFRRHPETRMEWNEAAPRGCAQRQGRILEHAARMVRPGGFLCYSTCTFNALENEGVIEAFLKNHPDFSLSPFSLPGLPACGGMLRIWPHLVRGEGHFAALMQKAGEQDREKRESVHPGRPGRREKRGETEEFLLPDSRMLEAAHAFLSAQFAERITPDLLFGGKLTQAPREMPPLRGIRTLRVGLQLGEVRNGVFQPDHALALALPGLRRAAVGEAEARAFQAGHPLPAPESLRGWVLPTLGGAQLGWAKASEGWMKNHYPKGLRRMGERAEHS